MIMTMSCGAASADAGATTVTPPVVAPGSAPVAPAQPASVADAASATRAVSVRSTWVLPLRGVSRNRGTISPHPLSGRRSLERLEVALQGLVPRVGRQLGVQRGDGDAVLAHRRRADAQLAQDPVRRAAALAPGLALHQHVGASVADLVLH